jgi:hypothetical protein
MWPERAARYLGEVEDLLGDLADCGLTLSLAPGGLQVGVSQDSW